MNSGWADLFYSPNWFNSEHTNLISCWASADDAQQCGRSLIFCMAFFWFLRLLCWFHVCICTFMCLYVYVVPWEWEWEWEWKWPDTWELGGVPAALLVFPWLLCAPERTAMPGILSCLHLEFVANRKVPV